MKLKTPAQFARLRDESKILNAAADFMEAGRELVPEKAIKTFFECDHESVICEACDLGAVHIGAGTLTVHQVDGGHWNPRVKQSGLNDRKWAALEEMSGLNISLERLDGMSIGRWVVERNDVKRIPTAETVAELRRLAAK